MTLLLVFGGVSKEYLHLFADHVDTEHCRHDTTEGLHIEPEHHHCDFLTFTLTPFVHDAFVYHIKAPIVYPLIHASETVTHLTPRDVPSSPLRGPPACMV